MPPLAVSRPVNTAVASPEVAHPPAPSAAAKELAKAERAPFTHEVLTVPPVAAASEWHRNTALAATPPARSFFPWHTAAGSAPNAEVANEHATMAATALRTGFIPPNLP